MNLYPKLTKLEKKHVVNSFDYSSQDQRIETNTKRILTHVLMCWKEDKGDGYALIGNPDHSYGSSTDHK